MTTNYHLQVTTTQVAGQTEYGETDYDTESDTEDKTDPWALLTLKGPMRSLYILLWLTPDDFTRQCGTFGPLGVNSGSRVLSLLVVSFPK